MDRIHQPQHQPSPSTTLQHGTVVNFDHWGTVWGTSTAEDAEREITQERAEGAVTEEWETTDRDGQPLRVVRVVHPKYGTDIRAFTAAGRTAVAA